MTDETRAQLVTLQRKAIDVAEQEVDDDMLAECGALLQGIGLIAIAIELDNMNAKK